jgi:hypothetical protein
MAGSTGVAMKRHHERPWPMEWAHRRYLQSVCSTLEEQDFMSYYRFPWNEGMVNKKAATIVLTAMR